ncbi:MAG: DUF3618 domain-containing protein [Pseudonocardiaceae bacterium]
MGEDPTAIRREIEQQRGEMSETVDALGYKADVKTRTKEAIGDRKDALVAKVSGGTPDGQDVKEGAQRAVGVAQENPLGLAIGSVAVGFVAGMLIPSTKVEDEKVGPLADEVKEKAKETGQEAVERGKQVAGEAAEQVRSSAAAKAEEARTGS